MAHFWIRAEERANEQRVAVMPDGVAELLAAGHRVTLEDSETRIVGTAGYEAAGATIAAAGSWREAPGDAIILGLKELPEDDGGLHHRHIFFGHAFKGQPAGQALLARFADGGGTLLDLEYLTDTSGRRMAAFGFWAGYVGAALSIASWVAQQGGGVMGPVDTWPNQTALVNDLKARLNTVSGSRPSVLIIGALGRTGSGARALCDSLGIKTTDWDMPETAHGGPFPEVLEHDIFLNCILAMPGVPVFVPASAKTATRRLSVIGDIACDPSSDFSPIKLYDEVTSWGAPTLRVADAPPLDIMAIDNLPSLLPLESSEDFASQLLPHLIGFDTDPDGIWSRAKATFDAAL